jgi:succinyl-CoA synthetase alpha subunit
MTVKNHVLKNLYRDSVALMRLSLEIECLENVEQATAIMGTDNNKDLLEQAGLLADTGKSATPNDLIIAFNLTPSGLEETVMASVQERLTAARQVAGGGTDYRPRSMDGAIQALPQANLAMISVPGEYAVREAQKALDLGLNVLLFSDNVPLEDEVDLKQQAANLGLLMMGPDCGTAIINGAPLGFANAVPSGRVGLVSASGSGLQHVTCLLAEAGEGVSHALGVGGRDLSAEVNGAMMLEGLRALQDDSATEIIVLISKPPAQSARDRVLEAASRSDKPCVVAFLGEQGQPSSAGNVHMEQTLEGAALRVLSLLGREAPDWAAIDRAARQQIETLATGPDLRRRSIRGLYSGGTMSYESLFILRDLGHQVDYVSGGVQSGRDTVIDMGDDRYTVGRPHPMIDYRARCEALVQEAGDPEVGVVLLDVILGYGSHPDPASELVPALLEAQAVARKAGRQLAWVVALCGSPDDPQNLDQQQKALIDAGAIVVHSNALAARIASAISRSDTSALPGGDSLG